MKLRITRMLGAAVVAGVLLAPAMASACATCFGKSDAPMAQGMNMGILTLLIVVMSVLAGIATFFAYILIRAARMEAANSSTPLTGSGESTTAATQAAQ